MRHIETNILDRVFLIGGKDRPGSPFTQWHLRKKFETIENLFKKYLSPGCRFIDIACGDGDAIVLANICQPDSELWGTDINDKFLSIAKIRSVDAKFFQGDMLNLDFLPEGYFDVVHEFGATFLLRDKKDLPALARQYFRLVKDGGIVLWEFPPKWSMAHLAYLFAVAPKITEHDTKLSRILKSFNPSKYTFLSDDEIEAGLKNCGYEFHIIERRSIWYFYCSGLIRKLLDILHKNYGDNLFESIDQFNKLHWPFCSGFYLAIQKV